jgi:hypothetical protein
MRSLQKLAISWRSPMDSERYFNQQIIERYRKLLDVISDETQRRQITNLLEEEEDKARDLRQSSGHLNLYEAA